MSDTSIQRLATVTHMHISNMLNVMNNIHNPFR